MNTMAVIALLSAWFLGALIVAALWPRERPYREEAALILPVGLMVGLGASSVAFFAASLVSERPALLGGVFEVAVAAVAMWRIRHIRWSRGAPTAEIESRSRGTAGAPRPHFPSQSHLHAHSESQLHSQSQVQMTWLEWILAFVFAQAAVVAGVVAWRAYQTEPFGGWDAWTIWNLHARFMLRAGTEWPELMRAAPLSWTHPDYPRLLPASVARVWAWSGGESPSSSALVSSGFAVAALALLVGAVAKLRGRVAALAGGLVLLSTPFFVTFAPNQHADIPLAGFMLATVVLVTHANIAPRRHGEWIIAGLCAGGAAWTKNEGLLFALLIAGVVALYGWRMRAWAGAIRFLGALAFALLPVLYFKLQLAPANDLISAPLGPRVAQLFDWSRHATLLSSLWRDLRGFGEWRIGPWLALALPFAAWRRRQRYNRTEWVVPVMPGLMFMGYYVVYLLSPHDLVWHLDSSLVRLLLQLWPLAIVGWCLVLPAPLASQLIVSSTSRAWAKPLLFALASCVAAGVSVGALSRQRAASEFMVRRLDGATVVVSPGAGWFPIERHDRDAWAWSSGVAKLQIQVGGRRAIGPLTVRFGLRGTSPGSVSVRRGNDVLWKGAVGTEFVRVGIEGLTLPPGVTTLEFSTDAPGVVEPAEHGGRTLAFALFNPRVE